MPLHDKPPPPDHDGFPDVDQHSCRLLGPTALVVQALLGLLVILSLVYKRHREDPKRPWRVWIFDVSKQLIGQMFVHATNLLISDVVAHVASGNACVLYFLNILIDTTLGVAIIYFLLKFFTSIITQRFELQGFESGQYGTPPSVYYWIRQTAVYVLCLTLMKLCVICIFAVLPGIFGIGEWLLSWLGGGDGRQVVFVMGIFPIIMNVIQFWLIDSIVKGHDQTAEIALFPNSALSQDREPLFSASEADDGDDERDEVIYPPKFDIENPPDLSISEDRGPTLFAEAAASEPRSLRTSGPSTPQEVGRHDVALHRYKSYPPQSYPPPSHELSYASSLPSNASSVMALQAERSGHADAVSDEWAWDEAEGGEWEDNEEREDQDTHAR